MIESRLDPLIDGTGGGYGRYAGLTTVQIAERFHFLVEEGQGRSARAILRLVHEQTEARGKLGGQRLLVAVGLTATVGLALIRLFAAPEAQEGLSRLFYASVGVTVLFALGTATIHRTTVRGEAQVREIRRLALAALDLLVARPGFVAKPLEREHVASLDELKRVDSETWKRVAQALR